MLIVFLWLRMYTNHGQELELPDYVGYQYNDALKEAEENSFRLKIQDSLHIVGKQGMEILKQNPKPSSLVKENRTIYVTVTKMQPDQITVSRLPILYGKNYHRKKRELQDHFEISSKIVGKKYDPGAADQILEVRYDGNVIVNNRERKDDIQIEKGGELEFVISERGGGSFDIPQLVCNTYDEAIFLVESLGLLIGDISYSGSVDNLNNAFIISQSPSSEEGTIRMGEMINITVGTEKPTNCQ